jgi:hypothetical protein
MACRYVANARCSVSKSNDGCGSTHVKATVLLPCTMAKARTQREAGPERLSLNIKRRGCPYCSTVTQAGDKHLAGAGAEGGLPEGH